MKGRRAFQGWPVGGFFCLLVVRRAEAGMPSFQLTDVVSLRLESISFFALVFLVFTWVLKMAWNHLARDFTRMPRLSFSAALGVTLVAGLFFGVVLTMISGARELMTPGAWNRVGDLYQLADPKKDTDQWLDSARTKALERLRTELWRHAQGHGGFFPASRFDTDIPEQVWQGIAPDNSIYAYWGGLKADQGKSIVAYESNVYGSERFVLRADGEISKMKAEALSAEFEKQMDTIFAAKTASDGNGGRR